MVIDVVVVVVDLFSQGCIYTFFYIQEGNVIMKVTESITT
jgi:hypothetical protein